MMGRGCVHLFDLPLLECAVLAENGERDSEHRGVLMLRNVPSDDFTKRPWASTTATELGRIVMRHVVIVLNDPNGLAKASPKIYLQLFPEEVRPHTLITRDNSEMKAFAKEMGTIVLKPLQGSVWASIFLVRSDDLPNINQMIDAVSRDGYVIAQEHLPAAAEGDTRLFMMNGRPLLVKGRYAAFRRVRRGADMRCYIHAGGKLAPAMVTEEALRIAEIAWPLEAPIRSGSVAVQCQLYDLFLTGRELVGGDFERHSPEGEVARTCVSNTAEVSTAERAVRAIPAGGLDFKDEEVAAGKY
jgi:glutathione synthase/RimK-type ligase-like ATP-grasp enzyme